MQGLVTRGVDLGYKGVSWKGGHPGPFQQGMYAEGGGGTGHYANVPFLSIPSLICHPLVALTCHDYYYHVPMETF